MRIGDSALGALAGAVGGIAGLAAMRLYWNLATMVEGEDPRALTNDEPPDALDEVSLAGKNRREGEASTAAVGRLVHERLTGTQPTSWEKERLSYGVHWGYGISAAAVFGMSRGEVDGPDLAGGLALGTGMWALGDEAIVPVLGLSKGPTAFPLRQHIHRWGAHLAYGVATALTTQAVRGLVKLPASVSTPSAKGVAWSAFKSYWKWKALRRGLSVGWRLLSRNIFRR